MAWRTKALTRLRKTERSGSAKPANALTHAPQTMTTLAAGMSRLRKSPTRESRPK